MVTEFNYRYADADNACIFVGVRLTRGLEERSEIINQLTEGGYQVVDLSDDEMAKLHVRYMVGGRRQNRCANGCSASNSRKRRARC